LPTGDTGPQGDPGATGEAGPAGDTGPAGPGVASGGTEGQILTKDSSDDYDTSWQDLPESSGVVSSATAPENTNSIWFNTENGNTYIYYDDFWTSIAGNSGAPIISDTAPTSPVLGTQWFNSSTGKSYLYYSNAWIEIDSNGTATASTGNAIINGAFEINQRNFSSTTSGGYGVDRWYTQHGTSGTVTASLQTFTPGTGPTGYESSRFFRIVTAGQSASNSASLLSQKIEDVRSFAGQTATVSFFAKSGSGTPSVSLEFEQAFGSGGSPSAGVGQIGVTKIALTGGTSWTRYTATVSIPSISGKTIGTNPNSSELTMNFWLSAGTDFNARTGSLGIQSNTFDIWGVQLEAGTVATPFRRNAPSIQAELAACQRYYFRTTSELSAYANFSYGIANSTTACRISVTPPTEMRIKPNSVEFANLSLFDGQAFFAVTGTTLDSGINTPRLPYVNCGVASGLTTFRPYFLLANNTTSAFLAFSAEL
jgi:hypothetical protein